MSESQNGTTTGKLPELSFAPSGTPSQSADKYYKDIQTLHGDKVSDPNCCDYDKRTPLHLAASEGCYQVTTWLLSEGANVNALDRFHRTPLEDSIIGNFPEAAKLLLDHGAKIYQDGELANLPDSRLSGHCSKIHHAEYEYDPDWEIDPKEIKLMDKLGEGEFGVVHMAEWHGTLVAAKIIKDSSAIALEDFRSELDVLRRVHHPNAVQFLGACTKREPFILVSELMTGGSLADALRLPREFSVRRSLEIAVDTARGLAYLHCKKPNCIIHRDLKPGNLMISGSSYYDREALVYDLGTVKLADFGLSKTLPVNKHAGFDLDSKFKLTGETGSYRFMAREVFVHEAYNNKVDVYSFAMILYQLFEHTPPFVGVDPVEAAKMAGLENKRPKLEKLAESKSPMPVLKALIQRCWDPSADNRPEFVEIVSILDAEIRKLPREALHRGESQPGCCSVQ